MSNVKIDTDKIVRDLTEAIPDFSLSKTIKDKTGVGLRAFQYYKHNAPMVVELLNFYAEKTGNSINDVIINKK